MRDTDPIEKVAFCHELSDFQNNPNCPPSSFIVKSFRRIWDIGDGEDILLLSA
jgi:hypothetical protein